MAGSVYLYTQEAIGAAEAITLTLRYGAPVVNEMADGITVMGTQTDPYAGTIVVDGSTVTIPGIDLAGNSNAVVSGVLLDVSGSSGQVSVNGSVTGGNAFFTGDSTRVVISAIEAPLMIPEKGITPANVNPLGGTGMAIFNGKEGFTNAIMSGDMVTLTVRSVPSKATLTVALGAANQFPVVMVGEKMLVRGMDAVVADQDNNIEAAEAVPEVTHSVTSTGEYIVVTLTLANDLGDDNVVGGDEDTNINDAMSETLSLELRLNAVASIKELVIPLTGKIDAWVAMAPDTKFVPMPVGGDVFTFKPATCSLLFPYGLVHAGFNTGITVSNTSMYAGNSFDGNLEFTFYANGADPEEDPLMLMTGPDQGEMYGLNEDGDLAGGNTFTILLSEALAEAGHDGGFVGHFVIKSNFMPCAGLGWVTDFMSVNQAYIAMTP